MKIKKLWDVFVVIITFFNLFIVMFELTFFLNESIKESVEGNQIYKTFTILSFICYLIDMGLNFFTGIYIDGILIMDLKIIRQKYMRFSFIFDLIAFIPILCDALEIDSILSHKAALYLHALFIFILDKYSKKLRDFNEFLIHHHEDYENFFSISVLYLRTIFVSHVMACFWYLIGISVKEHSWISEYKMMEVGWQSQYLNSLYWSLVTMLTVGYGDISPQNNLEKIYCIITMIIGLFF